MWLVMKGHVGKHWKVYAFSLAVLANVLLVLSVLNLLSSVHDTKESLKQANNVIAAKEARIQEFNAELGVAKSDIRTQAELSKKYKDELDKIDSELKDTIERHDLKLRERDASIAFWKGKVKGGSQTVTITTDTKSEKVVEVNVGEICDGKILAYEWADDQSRFHLKDPDISISGNETFEYSQFISVKGYVFTNDTGQLQVRRLEIKEVVKNEQDGNVVFNPVEGSSIRLVNSEFEYINTIEDTKEWLDIFAPRALVLFDTQLYPGIGVEAINFGRWIDWANVGVYGKMGFNLKDDFTRLQESTIGVGLLYHLVPPLVDTNLALGLSLNTPFNDLGRIMLSADAVFYLTNW